MNAKEFKDIVDEAVANGASRKDAEDYVVAGFKLGKKPGGSDSAVKPKTRAKKKPMKR